MVLPDIEEAFEDEVYSLKLFPEETQSYKCLVHHFTKAKIEYYDALNERAEAKKP